MSGRSRDRARSRCGGTTFLPTQLSGCALWLRADRGVTESALAVSSWQNFGTLGGTFDQATPAAKPTLAATGGSNSRAALTFDGGDQLDSTLAASAWASFHQSSTIFCVFKSTTNSSSASAFFCLLSDCDSVSSRTGFAIGWDNRSSLSRTDTMSSVVGNGSGTYVVSGAASNGSFPYNTDCILEHRLEYGASGDDYSVRSAGTSVLSVESGAVPAGGAPQFTVSVGALNSGFRFIGNIAEIVGFSRAITAYERVLINRYLGRRYALTVS